ncbi:hypothetical protein R1flu_026018 [Riccia fluitans]|uniref:F-box domain-containing protein n=1 Tax=Riccia fluitans TaxID=41844 RepID=A0ABD1XER8_9MARC
MVSSCRTTSGCWMDPAVWSRQLPVEVLHTILSWLPIRSFCRMRCVSKGWNFFALDPGFKQIVSRIPPPMPFWLVFNLVDQDIVFDTSTGSWHEAGSYFYTSCFLSDTSFTKKGVITSSGSLLLITTTDRQDNSMVVFNPINKTKKWIPKMPRIKMCQTTGIIMDKKSGSFKIYVASEPMAGERMRLQVYDSVKNKWEQTGPLMRAGGRHEVLGAVLHGGSIYCLVARLSFNYSYQVYRVGIGEENWELVKATMPRGIKFPHLFEHKGRLMMGGGIQSGPLGFRSTLSGVFVWELVEGSDHQWVNILHKPPIRGSRVYPEEVFVVDTDGDTHDWKTRLQMPEKLLQELVHGHDYFFVANGDYVGVGSRSAGSGDAQIMRYMSNLTTGSWWPLPVPSRNFCRTTQIEVTSTILFEPRLDVVL